MKKLAVVALGGNALLRDYELGTIEQQEHNTLLTLENLVWLIKQDYNLVITHGNGPQVGNIIMRNEAGEELYGIAHMPIDICVADSQGGIGYMIERVMRNVLAEHEIERNVVTVVSQVMVDEHDTAFQNPSKRVGKIYSEEEAKLLTQNKGWGFKITSKHEGMFRRVVPSPMPMQILNENIIKDLALAGNIVVAVGGGGIPVFYDKLGQLKAAEAVIDKDAASSLLACDIGAAEFYILTDVPFVYANYGTEEQKKLEFLNSDETQQYLKTGMFGEGTMAPKIRACLRFVNSGGEKAIITEATKLADKTFGTKLVK